MSRKTREFRNSLDGIVEDARALLAATKGVTEEKIVEARHRLEDALDEGKSLYGDIRDKAVARAHDASEAVHDNAFIAIGVALGVGALVGYLLSNRK